jgi:short-subunit dehydrogenase
MENKMGKRVLITGAANGIGHYLAKEFAKYGYDLTLIDIDTQKLNVTQDMCSFVSNGLCNISTIPLNICDEDGIDYLVQETNKIDILVNNAGIGYHKELKDTDMDIWKRLLDVNLTAPFKMIHSFVPKMIEQGGGQIVNVSSGQTFFQLPTWGAYSVSKSALATFSEILHYELKKHNIHVTTVYPFMVDTGFYDNVETKTLGAKLSMKFLPYYSQKPETVAKKIFKAVKNKKRVEYVNPINLIGKYLKASPIHSSFSKIINQVLS